MASAALAAIAVALTDIFTDSSLHFSLRATLYRVALATTALFSAIIADMAPTPPGQLA
jgi:hypothetical protein